MEFDENKKIEVEISENEFIETRTKTNVFVKLRDKIKSSQLDAYDMAFVPLLAGVVVSVGCLAASIAKFTDAAGGMGAVIQVLFG